MQYAICNETFEGWDHSRICRTIAELGYTGLEIAPFTLAPRITEVSKAERHRLRREAERTGVQIIGLHWLLAKTEGFHLTSPDPAVRQKTADYLIELAKACEDFGGDVLVFGSPAQRRIPAGATPEQAAEFAADTFRRSLPGFSGDVKLCLEPLAPNEADFLCSAAEAAELLARINHPNFLLHLDVKAMAAEAEPIPTLIHRHAAQIGHFHANDPNRRGPGFGDVDFRPIFKALHEIQYRRWVSVEVFDYSPDPVTIARESISYMKRCASVA